MCKVSSHLHTIQNDGLNLEVELHRQQILTRRVLHEYRLMHLTGENQKQDSRIDPLDSSNDLLGYVINKEKIIMKSMNVDNSAHLLELLIRIYEKDGLNIFTFTHGIQSPSNIGGLLY